MPHGEIGSLFPRNRSKGKRNSPQRAQRTQRSLRLQPTRFIHRLRRWTQIFLSAPLYLRNLRHLRIALLRSWRHGKKSRNSNTEKEERIAHRSTCSEGAQSGRFGGTGILPVIDLLRRYTVRPASSLASRTRIPCGAPEGTPEKTRCFADPAISAVNDHFWGVLT